MKYIDTYNLFENKKVKDFDYIEYMKDRCNSIFDYMKSLGFTYSNKKEGKENVYTFKKKEQIMKFIMFDDCFFPYSQEQVIKLIMFLAKEGFSLKNAFKNNSIFTKDDITIVLEGLHELYSDTDITIKNKTSIYFREETENITRAGLDELKENITKLYNKDYIHTIQDLEELLKEHKFKYIELNKKWKLAIKDDIYQYLILNNKYHYFDDYDNVDKNIKVAGFIPVLTNYNTPSDLVKFGINILNNLDMYEEKIIPRTTEDHVFIHDIFGEKRSTIKGIIGGIILRYENFIDGVIKRSKDDQEYYYSVDDKLSNAIKHKIHDDNKNLDLF